MSIPKLADSKAIAAIDSMRDSALDNAITQVENCVTDAILNSGAGQALIVSLASALTATTLSNLKIKISSQEIKDRIIAKLLGRVTNQVLANIQSAFDALADSICAEVSAQVVGQLNIPSS